MKLTRKWWKTRSLVGGKNDSKKFSLPTVDDFQPLDSQEQEEVVRSFELEHYRQSRQWRRHHAYFMEDVPSWMIIFADLVAILACLLALKGMLHTHWQSIRYSFYVGLVHAAFWSYCISCLPRFRWDVLWLPLGPLSAASICLYVDQLIKSSTEEIRTLQNYMYEYKRR